MWVSALPSFPGCVLFGFSFPERRFEVTSTVCRQCCIRRGGTAHPPIFEPILRLTEVYRAEWAEGKPRLPGIQTRVKQQCLTSLSYSTESFDTILAVSRQPSSSREWKVGYQTIIWGARIELKDWPSVLELISSAGFQGIEIFQRPDTLPALPELRAMLEKNHLELWGLTGGTVKERAK